MSHPSWRLERTVARLTGGGIGAEIDLARPMEGLSLQISDAPQGAPAWKILGVQFDPGQTIDAARLDAYVRGDDLVASYDEIAPRKVRAQIYWRRLSAADFSERFAQHVVAAFDLIVSVNTSLLDSDPQAKVASTLPPAAELVTIGADSSAENQALLVRPEAGQLSYAEMVHPAEICRSELKSVARRPVELIHHLFQQRLEKGVILRGWLRAAVVARKGDAAVAEDAYRRFALAEPPLTV